MANPSLKNGYLSIATELVEKFASLNIPGNEMRIIWVVWRKTWGWSSGDRKKDWDYISLSQFKNATGMKQANVVDSLKSLVVKKLLLKSEKGYKFNQNYEEWVVVKRLPPVVKSILPSSQKHTSGSSQLTTESSSQKHTYNRYKDITKDTNTKDIYAGASPAKVKKSIHNPLGAQIIKAFEDIDPKNKTYYNNKGQRMACDFLIQQYGLQTILDRIPILKITNKTRFFPTIYTPYDLKEKWVKLEEQVSKHKQEIELTTSKHKVAFT